MSVKINHGTTISVTKDGRTYAVPVEHWEKVGEDAYSKGDEQMGNDVCHRFALEGYQPQGSAGTTIDVEIEIWEYPDGVIETRNVPDEVSEKDVIEAFCSEMD